METFPLTCVSCYYRVKNKHSNDYDKWFRNTLAINVPYVFFSDASGIEYIKKFRGDLPTVYILQSIEEFYGYQYRHIIKTHPVHCPSVELKMIWNEKMIFLEKAANQNPFKSEFFQWIDAGVCTYRVKKPPSSNYPCLSKLEKLPKDKFIYSSSQPWNASLVKLGNYYHHVAGTSYILHISIIQPFVDVYKNYLNVLVDKLEIWTDQDILTYIFKDHPEIFYKLCDGYGTVVCALY